MGPQRAGAAVTCAASTSPSKMLWIRAPFHRSCDPFPSSRTNSRVTWRPSSVSRWGRCLTNARESSAGASKREAEPTTISRARTNFATARRVADSSLGVIASRPTAGSTGSSKKGCPPLVRCSLASILSSSRRSLQPSRSPGRLRARARDHAHRRQSGSKPGGSVRASSIASTPGTVGAAPDVAQRLKVCRTGFERVEAIRARPRGGRRAVSAAGGASDRHVQ